MTITKKKVISKEIIIEPSRGRKLARAFGFVILIMMLIGGSILLAITITGGNSVSIGVVIGGMIFWAIVSAILIHLGRTRREVIEEVITIEDDEEEEEPQQQHRNERNT
jgi:hypothetical protein